MAKHIDADIEAKEYLDLQLEKAKTEKLPDVLTFILTAAFIAALAVSFWVIPDRDFSEEENRTLAEFPVISAEKFLSDEWKEDFGEEFLSGKWMTDFATYMADQFPLRDQFVGLKAVSEMTMGKLENNSVMVSDGTLAERFDSTNTENVEKNTAAITSFMNACRSADINARFAVMGRTMDMYEFPLYGDEASAAAWAKLGGVDFIDMREAYTGRENEYIYYRTDHHYTTHGAYLAYYHLAPYFNYIPNPTEHYDIETASEEFYGTTYSKSGMKWIEPDTIELFRWEGDEECTVTVADTGEVRKGLYFRDYLEEKDKYAVFLGGNYGRVDITAPSADGEEREKLLIVKDSFAHALVPFLAEHFNVTMIDTRYYKRPVIRLAQDESFENVLILCNMDTLSSATPFDILRMGVK